MHFRAPLGKFTPLSLTLLATAVSDTINTCGDALEHWNRFTGRQYTQLCTASGTVVDQTAAAGQRALNY